MSILYSKRAQQVIDEAYEIITAAGTVACGTPHIMSAIMHTNDFKSAYPDEKYDDLRREVNQAIKVYKPTAVYGNRGFDWRNVEDYVLPAIHRKVKDVMKTSNTTIANLFLGICTRTPEFDLEQYLEGVGVDIVDLFLKVATYQEVDIENVDMKNIDKLNFSVTYDPDNKKLDFNSREKVDPMGGLKKRTEPVEPVDPFEAMFTTGTPDPKARRSRQFEQYCINLVEKAKGYRKPFIGREDVIDRTIQILCKAEKSNPIHTGEPGVGKTAVTLGLAKMIAENRVPDILKGSNLYELDVTALMAGTMYRGDVESRMQLVLNAMMNMEKPILFIDEIHMIVGAGAAMESSMDIANILKRHITEDKIKVIGATTLNEYRKYIEKDPALARRFQNIDVAEPSIEDAITIIDGLKESYEKYHSVTYERSAIEAAVRLTARHIHDRFLPDKAIDMIDEAGAYANVHPEIGTVIGEKNISDIVCKVCKIPKKQLESEEMHVLLNLEKELSEKVFGQSQAVKMVTRNIHVAKSGIGDSSKPVGVFLFVGPSGVGKTELANAISSSMDMPLVRFDMSEYSEQHTVSKLIGSPAGYVGYEDGGLLTNALLKTPYCVLLLDEIEKAHPSVHRTFLQMFDCGMLTDNKGRKIDCRNTVIIMTSNAGAADMDKPTLGFTSNPEAINGSAIDKAVNQTFSTEFRNRLSGIIPFNRLSNEMSVLIAKKELNVLKEQLLKMNVDVTFTDICIDEIAKLGTSVTYGARELKRVVDMQIKELFIKELISNTAPKKCVVDFDNNEFKVLPVIEVVDMDMENEKVEI